jgi:cyclohexadienyl dehydratase
MKAMLKGALIALGLAATMALGQQAASAADESLLHRILNRGTLRVGTTGDYPPYSELDQATNTYKGYEIDVVTALAADLGVKLEFVPTTWDTLGAGIAADKYDVVASGVTMTLERLKSVAFTEPYLDSPLVPLILKKDDGKFASWRDLDKEGVKLAVMAGTSAEESAKKNFTKAEIVSITAPALDYQELLAGRVTAAITDTVFIKKALAQYEKDFAVVAIDQPIEGQPNSMMTLQGDQVWLNWLNTWIELKKQTGFFDSLFQKWIAG